MFCDRKVEFTGLNSVLFAYDPLVLFTIILFK